MKAFLLILLAILSFHFSITSAQPILTAGNTEPVVGNNFSIYVIDSLFPGNAGANQTWDFSTLVVSGVPTTQSYISPSATPNGSSFPSANIAESDGLGNAEYFTTSSSSWAVNGSASSSSVLTTFNGLNLLTFPFSFDSSITNSSITGTFGSYATITGAASTTGDAYGTLILPGFTFNNVLRVRFTEYFDYNYGSSGHQIYNFTTYYWYDGVRNFPLFELSSFSTTGFGGNSFGSSALISSIASGFYKIPEYNLPLSVFPNPAQDVANINYSLAKEGITNISTYNVMGQEVFHTTTIQSPGENHEAIDLSEFAAGIYMIEVKSNGYAGRRKLVIR